MFRILTVVLIIVAAIFFLTDVQRLHPEKHVERFDDQVVLDLLRRKREAVARFDLDTVRALFSTDIVTEVVDLDGTSYTGGYTELLALINDYARTGLAYDKILMSHAVIVADDGMSSLVRMEALENWWFKDEFNNISSSLIETQRWVLEDGVPKIVSIKKELVDHDAFYLQRRKKHQLSAGQNG